MYRLLPPLLMLIVLLIGAPGCVPLREGGIAALPATEITGATSRQAIISEGSRAVIIGQVLILEKDGQITLTAEVGQLRDSGQKRLRMTGAWHDGAELPFRRVARAERFCVGARRCQGFRTGVFVFSAETFAAATRDGYPATLIGPDAVVRVVFPPDLFVEARDRARASGIWQG